jgi:hypothetical protein
VYDGRRQQQKTAEGSRRGVRGGGLAANRPTRERLRQDSRLRSWQKPLSPVSASKPAVAAPLSVSLTGMNGRMKQSSFSLRRSHSRQADHQALFSDDTFVVSRAGSPLQATPQSAVFHQLHGSLLLNSMSLHHSNVQVLIEWRTKRSVSTHGPTPSACRCVIGRLLQWCDNGGLGPSNRVKLPTYYN